MIDFKKCTDAAYEILLEQSGDIPIRANRLILPKPIVFDSLQNFSTITNVPMDKLTANQKADNGFLYKHKDFTIVLHNSDHCEERCNFTDSHEVGHILLGHKKDTDEEEVEANFFSAQLIMPTALIRYLCENNFVISSDSIQTIFKVSHNAANKKLITLRKYTQPHRWDIDLIKKYQDSLDKYIYL